MSTGAKKGLSSLLAMVVLAGAVFINASGHADAASEFAGGNGTDRNPYQIETVEQLAAMNNGLDQYYILLNDLDLTGYLAEGGEGWNDGSGWMPIGYPDSEFLGGFDGNGYTITGLTIHRDTDNLGLFSQTSSESFIENIGLIDVDVSGAASNVGSLAGISGGTVKNVHAAGTVSSTGDMNIGGLEGLSKGPILNSHAAVEVTGGMSVGGLVGQGQSTITDSYATGNVSGATNSSIGGLVGETTEDSVIANSYATGNISSDGMFMAGGLVGNNQGSITEAYATGNVTSTSNNIGGLVGSNAGPITNSYATGAVDGSSGIGGLVGWNTADVTNSYSSGIVNSTSTDYIGGLVGGAMDGTLTGSCYDKTSSGQSDTDKGEGKTSVEMKQQITFDGWDFDTIWSIDEGIAYPTLRNIDETAPSVVRATVEEASPDQVVVLFDEAVTITDTTGVTIHAEGSGDVAVTSAAPGAETNEIIFTIADPIEANQAVTITYDGSGTIADEANNNSSGFTETVINLVGEIVSFDSNGGSSVAPIRAGIGSTITPPVAPSKTGSRFAGWYADKDVWSNEWNFTSNTVSAGITLYAKWIDPPGLELGDMTGDIGETIDVPLTVTQGEGIVAIEFTLSYNSAVITFQPDSSDIENVAINYIDDDHYRVVIGNADKTPIPAELGHLQFTISIGAVYQDSSAVDLSDIIVSDAAGATTSVADASAAVVVDDTIDPTLVLISSTWPAFASSIDIMLEADGTGSAIAVRKWAEGDADLESFESGGTVITGNSVPVTANGRYTFYVEDEAGNGIVQPMDVDNYAVKGDANYDESPYIVDITDWQLVANFILHRDSPDDRQTFAADMNGDGVINVGDWVLIANLLLD